ncbi:Pectinesterase-like protein 5 [Elsinoe fawcettii]|nr:Pectinesterase-like protein 5 [Elsinoe fawcettii]
MSITFSAAVQLLSFLSFLQLAIGAPSQIRAVPRTSAPAGCVVVRKTGTKTGEYSTVAAAVAAVKASGCIFINPGSYEEQVTIKLNGLTVYGYTNDVSNYNGNQVTITHNLGSAAAGSLDQSSTVNIVGTDFRAYNVNFQNSYGTAGQAVAVTANGMRQSFYGCKFLGFQDTLYAKSGWQYYSNCYMEGAVDYIFGNAAAWFGECTIASVRSGAITASSRTLADDPAWYVFDHSTVTAAAGKSVDGQVNLGRPWRVNARVIYQYSTLTKVVSAAGWAPMAENATPTFMEFQNTGDGSNTSARKYLTKATAAVTKSQLWPGTSTWWDNSY